MVLQMILPVVLLLTLMSPMALAASGDWVIGSFENKASAMTESQRLGDVLNVPVRVTETAPHRLLVGQAFLSSDDATARFEAAGIFGAWRLVTQPSLMTEASKALATPSARSLWLLIDRSTDIQESMDVELRLSRLFTGVASESVMENGRLVHRIMLGPIRPRDVDAIRQHLAQNGFRTPVAIDHVGSKRSFVVPVASETRPTVSAISGSNEASTVPERIATQKSPNPKDDDFNLATLRRDKKDR